MAPRRPRLHDDAYLAWLRLQPCACGCRRGPPCDAAHLRAASDQYDKPISGGQRKPDDCWALPLKHDDHMQQSDWKHGELAWWRSRGIIDPFALCIEYYTRFGGTGGKPRASRQTITRKPKGQRAKIPSRPFPKTHRPMRSKRP